MRLLFQRTQFYSRHLICQMWYGYQFLYAQRYHNNEEIIRIQHFFDNQGESEVGRMEEWQEENLSLTPRNQEGALNRDRYGKDNIWPEMVGE